MKVYRFIFILMGLLLALSVFMCQEARAELEEHECPNKAEAVAEADKAEEPDINFGSCPETRMTDKCLTCHTAPTFALKEADPHDVFDYAKVFYGAEKKFFFLFDEHGRPKTGYFILNTVDASDLQRVMAYCDRHGVNHLVIELFTPGGSLIDAYKCVGLIRHWQAQGNVVETRCYGLAASAGFLIFASGTRGARFLSPQSELMWHELQTLAIFSVESPSDKEDEAKVLRHLQDTANAWLAEVSGKTKAEIDELVRKKEFWINGEEAVAFGFADGLLGK